MTSFEQFARGDPEAFEALFRRFQRDVYGWIVRIVRDPAAAEELTVETFWRIHRAHARFDPSRSFEAWARRIATNLALSHLKTVRPEVALSCLRPGWSGFSDAASAGRPPDPGVQRDTRERIERAFRALPAKLRAAATLALIEERPYEEIAQAMGTSVGTVKSRVFRAVRLLREKLKALGVEP